MPTEQKINQYKSFLLRLWQEGEAEPSAAWRGEVESIQTGQKWQFDSLTTVFELLQTTILEEPTPPSSQVNG
ncbi:MAG: hypothetical protein BroJett011_47290 [Chloroflexota bacterium]|nr:MAG: hypothetical protein BroJett011_47290 [Chloroflexota bacterium]